MVGFARKCTGKEAGEEDEDVSSSVEEIFSLQAVHSVAFVPVNRENAIA